MNPEVLVAYLEANVNKGKNLKEIEYYAVKKGTTANRFTQHIILLWENSQYALFPFRGKGVQV
jgi:hypothetical protein